MYVIEVDAPDLRKTTYADLGLQSPTGCCLALSLCWNIKAVIFPQGLLIESSSLRFVPLKELYHF